jgi:hypothetical protein
MRDRGNKGASWPTRLRQNPILQTSNAIGITISIPPKEAIVNPVCIDALREAIFLLEMHTARLLGQPWTAERSLSVDTADAVIDVIKGAYHDA